MKAVHFAATLGLACSLWFLTTVFMAGRANALTLSLTETAGGVPLVGDALTLSVGSSSATFSQPIDALSPKIAQLVNDGTLVFELDFNEVSGSILETTAFQDVVFTSVTTNNFLDESVSFNFASETITRTLINATPLPAALPLFATGLGGLGLLGWRRKRKAQVVAA